MIPKCSNNQGGYVWFDSWGRVRVMRYLSAASVRVNGPQTRSNQVDTDSQKE